MVQGYIFGDDHGHCYYKFAKEMSQRLSTGQIKYREHLIDRFENVPNAFISMLDGQNFEKLVIRVNEKDNRSFKKGKYYA